MVEDNNGNDVCHDNDYYNANEDWKDCNTTIVVIMIGCS